MMDGTKKRQNIWKPFRKGLALGLLLLLLGVIGHTLLRDDSMNAQADSHYLEVTLTQTKPEEGFLMIPGVAIPQDITAGIEKTTERSYVYVKVVEQNNEHDYLLYEMAEGWLPLQTLAGETIPGVYYRCCDGDTSGSWPILKDQEITVNPETVTWSVLEQLSADATDESWPRLIYEAYGVALEYSDELMTPLDGWSIVDGSKWKVVVKEIIPPAPAIITALQAPEGAEVSAYDVTLQDENGYCMQPYEPVEVQLPVATGADAAIVLHVLDNGSKIRNAIPNGNVIGLQTGTEKTTLVEVIEAKVVDGNAVFEAASFSTYYVVSGHNETLKSWWQDSTSTGDTRYNLDLEIYSLDATATGEKTFIVEPDSSFYMWVENEVNPTWEVTENKSNGHITVNSVANDSVGKVIRVSGDAVTGESLTFIAGGWTVTIEVDATVITDTFDLPIYIGINMTPNSSGNSYVGNEPRVSGNDTFPYVYITSTDYSLIEGVQKTAITPVAGVTAETYLKTEEIEKVLDKFLPGTDDKSVKGLIGLDMATDNNNNAIDLSKNVYENIPWDNIATALVTNFSSGSQLKATDGTDVTQANSSNYELRPYVIKVQTSKHVGWHIQACFVPKGASESMVWVNYDENLPAGAKVEYMNVPLRTPLKGSSGYNQAASIYMVEPSKSSGDTNAYNRISESEYITLADGRKLRFVGWNTKPNGSGCAIGLGSSLNIQSCNNHTTGHEHDTLENGGTLYAFWSAIAERLELHKIVESDEAVSGSQSFEFKLTITSLEGVELSQDGGDKIVFELYDAATDTLVPNSKDSNTALAVNNNVTIRMTANQYAAIFLPTGTQYKIEEVNIPHGYTNVNSVNAEGTIGGKGNDGNVIFTNSYNSTKGFLNLEKIVVDATNEADPERLFTFTVSFDDSMITNEGKSNEVKFTLYNKLDEAVYDTSDRVTCSAEGSSYTVLLKHGERILFNGLEAGTTYSITETEVENYSETVTTQVGDAAVTQATNPTSGTIVEDKFTNVEYTNTYNQPVTDGTLTIEKKFNGCTPETGESFVFTVTDANGAEVAEVVIYGKGPHSKTIKVPYGDYTVTEDDSWSWRYTAAASPSQNVTVSRTSNPTVTFTNTKTKSNWLDASAGVTNDFGSKTATPHN